MPVLAARRIGISRQNLSLWRTAGLRALPTRANLESVAEVIGRPYREVLDAALHDTGYSPAGDDGAPRAYDEVLADTVRTLTEATRLTTQRVRRTAAGGWEPDPDAPGDPIDWAEFVTEALAGAAANAGSVDAVLAGRPGSWEAEGVHRLLDSAVGADGEDLLWHRTDPVDILLNVERILDDYGDPFTQQYEDADEELNRRIDAVPEAHPVGEPYDPPAWTKLDPTDPAYDALYDEWFREAAKVPLTPAEQAEEDAVTALLELRDRLDTQRRQELAAYGAELQAAVEQRVPDLNLSVPVHITVQTDSAEAPEGYETPIPDYSTNPLDAVVGDVISQVPRPSALAGTPLSRAERPIG